MTGAADAAASAAAHRTDSRILDAALEVFQERGFRRTAVDDVASAAGVTRVTVYRRFGSKDGLVRAVVLREIERIGPELAQIMNADRPLEERVVDTMAASVMATHRHPLFTRLLHDEPETLLPALTVDAQPLLELGTRFVARLLQDAVDRGELHDVDVAAVGELLTRLALSVILTPGGPIGFDDAEHVRAFGRRHVLPILGLG